MKKMGIFQWFFSVRPRKFLTLPFIYGMILPVMFFDLCISLYQLVCFPIYGIRKVHRSRYIAIDHQNLAYLNVIEKIHCVYCSYVNGTVAYATDISARTEQYFCPIKHDKKTLGAHSRTNLFLEYGDSDNLHVKLDNIRASLTSEDETK